MLAKTASDYNRADKIRRKLVDALIDSTLPTTQHHVHNSKNSQHIAVKSDLSRIRELE